MVKEYVNILISEYIERKQMNARYSERAFAQSIGLSPGFLKLLFQGKKQLGINRAKDIANRLGLKEPKRTPFLMDVQKASSRSSKRLSSKFILHDKDFHEISNWFTFAILELVKVRKGHITSEQIAENLGISKIKSSFALKKLTKLGLLELKKNRVYQVPTNYEIPSISSEGIRRFHRQMFQLAHASIEQQTSENRELRSLTLAFEKGRLEEAKKEIQKFVTHFEKKFNLGNQDSVYQLSMAFFQLNKEEL